jgi:hypothetical protein
MNSVTLLTDAALALKDFLPAGYAQIMIVPGGHIAPLVKHCVEGGEFDPRRPMTPGGPGYVAFHLGQTDLCL